MRKKQTSNTKLLNKLSESMIVKWLRDFLPESKEKYYDKRIKFQVELIKFTHKPSIEMKTVAKLALLIKQADTIMHSDLLFTNHYLSSITEVI